MRIIFPMLILVLLLSSAVQAEVRLHRLSEGGLHPQVAVDEQRRVHLIYQSDDRKAGDIYYIRSDDGGTSWSEPLRVNSQPGSAYADSVRGPHLAIGRGGRVHVAWMGSDQAQPRAQANARPMLYSRLNDRGGFEPQRNVIQQRPGLDGGGSIAADAHGNVYIAWHAPGSAESKDETDRRVWLTRSSDDGKTFAVETQASLDGTGACACCGLRLFCSRDGRLFVFYRTAVERMDRDALLLASDEAGAGFTQVLRHPWRLGQCPMSTFNITQSGDALLAAWETQRQVHFTRIDPATLRAADPVPAPGGEGQNRKHPAVVVNGEGHLLLAWVDNRGWSRDGVLRWQVFDSEGNALPEKRGEQEGMSFFSVPTLFVAGDGAFVVVY